MRSQSCNLECNLSAILASALRKCQKRRENHHGSVAKWLRQRIANPPSWVQLPPEPLNENPRFFNGNVGFFVLWFILKNAANRHETPLCAPVLFHRRDIRNASQNVHCVRLLFGEQITVGVQSKPEYGNHRASPTTPAVLVTLAVYNMSARALTRQS